MTTPGVKKALRAEMATYMGAAESFEDRWHYTQARPFHGYGTHATALHAGDCSSYVSLIYNHAMTACGHFLRDPLGENYSGWGYTGTLITWLDENGTRTPDGKYLTGDIVLYGPSRHETKHTAVCKMKGSASSSRWSSFGSERGPLAVGLHYRPDILGVWRHPGLA